MKSLLVFLGIVLVAYAYSTAELADWEAFKEKFDKHYGEAEDAKRLARYLEVKEKVDKHNRGYEEGIYSYKLSISGYADWFEDELKHLHGFKKPNSRYGTNGAGIYTNMGEEPDSIDWRDYGAVTPVKNQGQCGVCWSFATTGVLEAQFQRKTGKLVSLSEQNLVDCIQGAKCKGNWMDVAFEYAKNGIDTEADYPYDGTNGVGGECRRDSFMSYGSVASYWDIPYGDEALLKNAVGLYGPVAVALDASLDSFGHYGGGIYHDDNCQTNNPVHAVLVVGYGTENGEDYWIVKNSWDTWWGEDGYIRIRRNANNHCGIASYASFALVN